MLCMFAYRARVKDDEAHIGLLEEKMSKAQESHAGLRQAFGTISLQVQRVQDYRTALKNVFESSFCNIEVGWPSWKCCQVAHSS